MFFLRCPVLFCPSVDDTALLHMSVIYWQPQQVCLCVLPAMSRTVLSVCWRHCPPPHVSDILAASTGLSMCSSCDVQYCSVRLLATLPSSTCQRCTGSPNRFVYVFFLRCPVLFCCCQFISNDTREVDHCGLKTALVMGE